VAVTRQQAERPHRLAVLHPDGPELHQLFIRQVVEIESIWDRADGCECLKGHLAHAHFVDFIRGEHLNPLFNRCLRLAC